jgi:iron uptake system EfeUOB component EfeO/EfeM
MNFMYHGNPSTTDLLQSLFACPSRLIGRLISRPFIVLTLNVAVVGIGLVAAGPGRAASLDEGVEHYRAYLIVDVDRTLTSAKRLRDGAAAGDLAAAKQAWIEARIGWERSEVFTTGFVPELDRDIDAWPNGLAGFHAIEARLFGASQTDFVNEVNALLLRLAELSTTVRNVELTAQGLLNGVVRLTYEVGESKVDGGESRVSGTSLNDMRNNVDGIELAYGTIFASEVDARDPQLGAGLQRSIDELKTMVDRPDLRHLDPDQLRAATEELVLKLQSAAPLLRLEKPTLEANAK